MATVADHLDRRVLADRQLPHGDDELVGVGDRAVADLDDDVVLQDAALLARGRRPSRWPPARPRRSSLLTDRAVRPSVGCAILPSLISVSTTCLTSLTGIAKPRPLALSDNDLPAVLMPITSEFMLISGPPELPWLIDASVCTASMTVSVSEPSPDSGTGRCSALMMPCVTVLRSPSGAPAAITSSPTLHLVGVAEPGHRQVVDVVDLEHGQVGLGVAADEVGGHFLAVVEHHRRLELAGVVGGLGDDVVVGDDVAAAVDDDARALRCPPGR